MPETLEKHISAEILSLGLILSELIIKILSCLAISRVVLVACIKVYVFCLPSPGHTDLEKVVHAGGVEREVVVASDLVTSEVMARQETSVAVIHWKFTSTTVSFLAPTGAQGVKMLSVCPSVRDIML